MVQFNVSIMGLLQDEMRLAQPLACRNTLWTVAVVHLSPPSVQSYLPSLQKLPLAILCSQAASSMGISPWAPETSELQVAGGWDRYPPTPERYSPSVKWSLFLARSAELMCLPSTEENCFCHKEWFSSCSVCLQLSFRSFSLLAHGLHAWNSSRGTGWNLWSADYCSSQLSDLNINVGMRSSEATSSKIANLQICHARNPYFNLLPIKNIDRTTCVN